MRGERLGKFRKKDQIAPVYTICLYHGIEEWDGPRCLKDMMDFDREGSAGEMGEVICGLSDASCMCQRLSKLFGF